MENHSVNVKKKTKRTIILLVAIFLVSAVGLGGVYTWKKMVYQPGVEEVEITEEQKVADADTLRELLANKGTFAIELIEDIRIDEGLVVKGKKTLKGDKSIVMELCANAHQSVITVSKGASLTLEGVTLDANGIANGVTVEKNADFIGTSGEILYGVPYGVLVGGNANIKDLFIDHSMDIGVCVKEGGKASLEGTQITNSVQTGVHIQSTAQASISSDTIIDGAHYLVRNRGICEITGGTLCNASGYLVYSTGDISIDYKGATTEDKLEWYGADGEAGIRIGAGAKATISGLYLHDVAGRGIRSVNDTGLTVTNCVIEKTGSYGIDCVNGKQEANIQNVELRNTKSSAIRVHGTVAVNVKDVKVNGTEGFGIKNENTLVSAENITLKNCKQDGVWGNEGSTTEVNGAVITKPGRFGVSNNSAKMTLKKVVITDPGRMGYVGKVNSSADITDITITGAKERAIYNLGGQLTAKEVVIKNAGIFAVSTAKSKNKVGSVTITDLKVTGVKEKDALNTYQSVLKVTNADITDVKRYGALASKDGKMTLTNVEISNCTQRGVMGSGGIVILKDVVVKNAGEFGVTIAKSEEFVGELNAENLTIKDVKTKNALNNNGSVMTVKGAKISKVGGNGLYAEKGGKTTISDVDITDCTKRGIYLTSDGTKVVLKNVKLSDVGNTAVFQEAGTIVEGDTFSIKNSSGYGVFMQEAQFDVTDVVVHNTALNPFNIDKDSTAIIRGEKSKITKNEDTPVNVAIKVIDSDLKIYDGTYNGFTKENGAVIYNSNSDVTIYGGTFKDNVATERGAVLYATGSKAKVTIEGGTFENNMAQGNYGGGAIACAGNTKLFVKGGIFKNNRATAETTEEVTVYGGGAIESNGNVEISGGIFQANTAERGGVIYIDKKGNLKITGGTFGETELGNVASYRGGVIYIADERTSTEPISISGAHFGYNKSSNSKAVSAGVIYVGSKAKVNIEKSTFIGNMIEYTGSGKDKVSYGGTMYINGSEVTITDSTISESSAMRGGAIYANTGSIVTLNGGVYDNNTATIHGGFIYNNEGTLTINESEKGVGKFTNHTAKDRGGVILNNGTTTINNGTFTDNKADGKMGGGVVGGTGGAVLTINNGKFQRNSSTYTSNDADDKKSADVHGGGVIESNGRVTISGGTFLGNTAMKGGVIYLDVNGKLKITGGTFGVEGSGNSATYRGGVICTEDERTSTESIKISNATFSYNRVTHNSAVSGGTMYLGTKATVVIDNCTFEHNKADNTKDYVSGTSSTYSYGGTLYANDNTVEVKNTSINHSSATQGGAIYASGNNSVIKLNNTEFKENTVERNGTDVFANGGTSGGLVYLYGKVKGEIGLNQKAKIVVEQTLKPDSQIVIRILNSVGNSGRLAAEFSSEDVMNASKEYFTLHSASNGKTISYANNKATVVK